MALRLLRRISSALPDAFVDPPGRRRTRRDRIADAAMYVVAFAISTATLVDTWERHPPWSRPVAVPAVIATVVSRRWRRPHPGAVGIGVGALHLSVATVKGHVSRLLDKLEVDNRVQIALPVQAAGEQQA